MKCKFVKRFEFYHKNHTLVTLDLSEVIGNFNIFHTKPLNNEAYKGNKSDKNSEKFQSQGSKNMEFQESMGVND